MSKLIIPLAIVIVLAVAVRVFELFLRSRKPRFQYSRKDSLMTPAECECYRALVSEMGADYDFFPQIHLDAIVNPVGSGKDRFYAFRHINQKSVDFVACDKKTMSPLFALEVDDKTHSQPRRIERDREVGRILEGAGIPLIRIENRGHFNPKELGATVIRGLERFAKQPER